MAEKRCGYFCGDRIPPGCRHFVGRLVSALEKTPCYGCSIRFGDNTPDGRRDSRGCVNCQEQRALLAECNGE